MLITTTPTTNNGYYTAHTISPSHLTIPLFCVRLSQIERDGSRSSQSIFSSPNIPSLSRSPFKMRNVFAIALLVMSANTAFVCNDKNRKMHVCCESYTPSKPHKGKPQTLDGMKCKPIPLFALSSHRKCLSQFRNDPSIIHYHYYMILAMLDCTAKPSNTNTNALPGLAAYPHKDKKTKRVSWSCPLGMIGVAGFLPSIPVPSALQLEAGCCKNDVSMSFLFPFICPPRS